MLQIGLRPIRLGNDRPHQIVDPGHERPGQLQGDRDRTRDHQPGEEIIAQRAIGRRSAASGK